MCTVTIQFESEVLKGRTKVNVVMPSINYDTKLKTLYLLHGGDGSADDWLNCSQAHSIASEHGFAVIMPEVGGESFYCDMHEGADYFTYIDTELMDKMQMMFPLSDNREDRFVAGLSMGGYGAVTWGLRRPDKFAAIGNFSGASDIVKLFATPGGPFTKEQLDEKVMRIWGGIDKLRGSEYDTIHMLAQVGKNPSMYPDIFAGVGTDDFVYGAVRDYVDAAGRYGVNVRYEEMPGGHEWKVWNEMLKRFVNYYMLRKQ
ncbi:MAG: hypothetical protein HFH14_04590 [Lachnospiraceae bacterium]|nr:hypothetical protein [Lachnospiraceae bacterium]